VVFEQASQKCLERAHARDQFGVCERTDVGAARPDLVDLDAVGVVGGEISGTEYLLGEPGARLLLVFRVLVEVALLALVARDARHVAEVLQVDGLGRHPRDADTEQSHQRHVDVQIAAEGRQHIERDRLVVKVVIPHTARDECVSPARFQTVLETD